MNRSQRIIGLAMAISATLIGAWLYPHLPQQIPTHWNAAGQIDGYTTKPWGVFLFPGIMFAILGIFELIVRYSPRGFRLDKSRHVVGIFALASCGMLFLIFIAQIWAASGHAVQPDRFVLPGIGLLFIVLGNYMGKVPKNFFIGIRTPWTLASDEVWGKTHRFAGVVFVIAGLAMLVSAPFGAPVWEVIAAGSAAGLLPLVYSFVAYRQLEGFSENEEE